VRASAAAALAVLSVVVTGCSSGVGTVAAGNADKAHGKELFINGENGKPACAACHTLAEAKAQGKIGPDLDASFRPDRKQGFEESTIRQVVADQIRFPGDYGPPPAPTMPKNLVTGAGVDDVAAYVAYVAGQKGVSVTATAAPAPTTTQAAPPSGGGGANLAAGKQAFMDNGCGACHTLAAAGSNGTVGPDLDKLKTYAAAANMPLDQFIRESIVKPNAYIQKGYAKGIMPTSFASLPKSMLDALVAFLAASAKG
jgi:cytochrome c oxidase subunit 2